MALETLSPADRYAAYDPWAWLYDQSLGARYCQEQLPLLEHLFLSQIPVPAKLLDLCCGTGHITRSLLNDGYSVTGIDGSESMLHHARDKASTGEFILADARHFTLDPVYDGVFSVSHSLNHLICLEDVQRVFQNVYQSLKASGLFLFDLALKGCYDNRPVVDGEVTAEYAWAIAEQYDPATEIGQFHVTAFWPTNEYWQRSDWSYSVKDYDWMEIQSALQQVGFDNIQMYTREGEEADRTNHQSVYFVSRKPA